MVLAATLADGAWLAEVAEARAVPLASEALPVRDAPVDAVGDCEGVLEGVPQPAEAEPVTEGGKVAVAADEALVDVESLLLPLGAAERRALALSLGALEALALVLAVAQARALPEREGEAQALEVGLPETEGDALPEAQPDGA